MPTFYIITVMVNAWTISYGLCWNIDSRKTIWRPRAHFGSKNDSLKGLIFCLFEHLKHRGKPLDLLVSEFNYRYQVKPFQCHRVPCGQQIKQRHNIILKVYCYVGDICMFIHTRPSGSNDTTELTRKVCIPNK